MAVSCEQFSEELTQYKKADADLRPTLKAPDYQTVLESIGGLSSSEFLLGVGADGAIVLNTHNADAGSVLITGDNNTGKIKFLRMLVAQEYGREVGHTKIAVITTKPQLWKELEAEHWSLGVYRADTVPIQRFFRDQKIWLSQRKSESNSTRLVIVDNLYLVKNALESVHETCVTDFRALLREGPRGGLMVAAGVDSRWAQEIGDLSPDFRTKIVGTIAEREIADALGCKSGVDVAGLLPGIEYSLQHPLGSLSFWRPSVRAYSPRSIVAGSMYGEIR